MNAEQDITAFALKQRLWIIEKLQEIQFHKTHYVQYVGRSKRITASEHNAFPKGRWT